MKKIACWSSHSQRLLFCSGLNSKNDVGIVSSKESVVRFRQRLGRVNHNNLKAEWAEIAVPGRIRKTPEWYSWSSTSLRYLADRAIPSVKFSLCYPERWKYFLYFKEAEKDVGAEDVWEVLIAVALQTLELTQPDSRENARCGGTHFLSISAADRLHSRR